MRILLVIHGMPPRYNAGSEVYTQSLARGLAERHEVRVFTRHEDPFAAAYQVHHEADISDSRVQLQVLNNPESRDRYRHAQIDAAFAAMLDEFRPDAVHVNHVSHLSTSLVQEASLRHIPVVFTLHDFWLMCPRGQFLQRSDDAQGGTFPLCDGQEDRKCAERCYSLYFSGGSASRNTEIAQWAGWVAERMRHVREMASLVDAFVVPSRHLERRFRDEFGLDASRLHYLDYGFDLERLRHRTRESEDSFVFGYIGTHIPAKGIHNLLEAFAAVRGTPRLRIWGRPRDPFTASLRRIAANLPNGAGERVEWLGEYTNEIIVPEVFNRVDAIVVPSIWEENSPLVIHEAQQARVPVITADVGGMAEYVRHEHNGLLFRHRNAGSLATQMQRFVDEPSLASRLGARGYLFSPTGDVASMAEHVRAIEGLYAWCQRSNRPLNRESESGPWRITFDTNPDDCNLRCVMCEEHSPHSTLQKQRRERGQPRRRMDIALVRRILEVSRGTRLREIIPSTMGEPLLYEHFDEIIDMCGEFGVRLNLTTNGTFPKRGPEAWAERLVPVTSDVKISINGATKATQEAIMLGTHFETLIDHVRRFVAVRDRVALGGGNRCRVTFQTTFLDSNIAELPSLVELAASLGVDRVKGHHLWVHFTQIRGLSMRRSPEAVRRWNEIVQQAHAAAEMHRLPHGGRVLLENIHVLDPEQRDDIAPKGECPFLGEEAWISAEGRFNPCCAPDAERQTLGDFGSLASQSIQDIWHGTAYTSLRQNYMENRLCQTCNMRRPVTD